MEVTQMILEFLDKVGTQLSTTGKQVFDIYTQQAYAEGLVDLISAGIYAVIMILCIVAWVKCFRYLKDGLDNYEDTEIPEIFVVICMIVLAVLIVGFFIAVMDNLQIGILKAYNPAYYAVDHLLTTVKDAVGK